MSGHGAPATTPIDATGLKIVVVAGQWHDVITDGLIAGAERVLEASHASFTVVRVAGSFELPVVSKAALESGADAVVALGVIIRGGTPHFEFVSSSGHRRADARRARHRQAGRVRRADADDEQQGIDRAGLAGSKEDKGAEAADAAIRTALLLREIRAAS